MLVFREEVEVEHRRARGQLLRQGARRGDAPIGTEVDGRAVLAAVLALVAFHAQAGVHVLAGGQVGVGEGVGLGGQRQRQQEGGGSGGGSGGNARAPVCLLSLCFGGVTAAGSAAARRVAPPAGASRRSASTAGLASASRRCRDRA